MELVSELLEAHRTGRGTPAETIARTFARIRAHGDPAVFITLANNGGIESGIEVHSSLLNVVLHEQPQIKA